jgi:eukaryotic-like serine/threonine-protein kinase
MVHCSMASSQGRSRARVVGRYALQQEIAAGGMASVFLGKMCGPGGFSPIVAIKSLHPQFAKDPEFVRMFLDEARLAGRIRHPNIVPVIDVHAEGDELFLVLEYVHGESLARLVSASRRAGELLSTAICAAILSDVLQGLHAAHEAKDERGEPLGIVHRDVSPQNVLVGADGVARVLDFGIAKATGRVTTTRDGQVKGKFAYMAPEQLRGENVDRRADVYSAAVVLWEALTGERLFRGENEGHTVERVLFGALSPPSAVRTDVSAALDAVVMRGLSRERADRFGTAKEMAIALAAAVLPASTPEVGEWVESRAIDALERRAKLVEEVEASGLPTDVTPSPASESSAAVVLLAPRTGRMRTVVVGGALVVAALGVGLGVHAYATPSPAAASTAPTAPEPTSPPSGDAVPRVVQASSSDASSASSASPLETGIGAARGSAVGETKVPRPSTTGPSPSRSVKHAAKGAVSPSRAACQRRGADGEIEFDMECLRATQQTP